MKFKKLISKIEKTFSKLEQGAKVKPAKLEKLQQLLSQKADRYQARLENEQDAGKRSKLNTRLNVVRAQLEKSKNL